MPAFRGVAIGAGYFAGLRYEAWTRIPEVEIAALSNRNIERARPIMERYGVPRHYTDGRTALQPLGKPERDHPYTHENRNFAGDCCYTTQRHFIDRLIDGRPFETSGDDYLEALAVQEAVYEPARRGVPAAVDDHRGPVHP